LPAARRGDASLAIGALVVCGALYAAQLAMFSTTDDQDAALHIVARGHRALWQQPIRVGSPRMARYDVWRLYTHPQLYRWMGWNVPWRDIWEAVLVRE
jgi:hypothetical protein